jgi:hypothetical protein
MRVLSFLSKAAILGLTVVLTPHSSFGRPPGRSMPPPSLSAGTVSAAAGSVAALPITFKPSGPVAVASLQFSVILPAGWTLSAVEPGAAAQSAGKSVSFRAVNGKVIVFGLDQNIIGPGVVAVMSVKIPKEATAGKVEIPLREPVFSNSAGVGVVAGKSGNGTITVGPPVPAP